MVRVLGLTIAWMVIWAAIGATLSIVIGVVDPPSIDPGEGPVDLARIIGGVGGAAGLVFGLLLTIGERGRTLGAIALQRAVLWGALAGAAPPLLTGINNSTLVNTIPFGMLSAAACVGVARRVGKSGR